MITNDMLFNHVSTPPLFRGTKIVPTHDGWHRVNVYAEVEKANGYWGLSIVKSFVVREVDGQYLDFHHTTPPENN